MSGTVIHVEELGKRYRVGERERYLALRDVLTRTFTAPFRRGRGYRKRDYLWALRNVSFDVQQGEVIGLIGRNGAGKTTLLKILSRITSPTEGFAEIHGRVGSLLEVGTGFHPELTGRENIFLSGAVLGMGRHEIGRKYDAIVDFAGVERYIDTPLKHFSTGMQMRLAFAVAAHLEPEILFVDEVLAVGDMEFQKKCLGKMHDVSKSGRTIVFVSHQMNQIRRLCERVFWIENGMIRRVGPTGLILGEYEAASSASLHGTNGRSNGDHTQTRFLNWQISGAGSDVSNILTTLGCAKVNFTVEVFNPVQSGHHGIALFNSERQVMWASAAERVQLEPGIYEFNYTFPSLPLRPGAYSWQVSLWEEGKLLDLWDCTPDMIIATEVHQHPQDQWKGLLNMPSELVIGRRS
jgi:lipopolysaccharide transport system ATP-binding protein